MREGNQKPWKPTRAQDPPEASLPEDPEREGDGGRVANPDPIVQPVKEPPGLEEWLALVPMSPRAGAEPEEDHPKEPRNGTEAQQDGTVAPVRTPASTS